MVFMPLNDLLTYLLKENIDEAAKTLDQAQSEGLALFKTDYRVILISPNEFEKQYNEIYGETSIKDSAEAVINLVNQYKPMISKMFYPPTTPKLDKYIKTISENSIAFGLKIPDQIYEYISSLFLDLYTKRKSAFKNRYDENKAMEGRLKLNQEQEHIDAIIERARTANSSNRETAQISLSNILTKSIIGYIYMDLNKECNTPTSPKTYTVNSSAAVKGWGPLTYDIAMSIVSPAYLMADRNSNSQDADKIWMYYLKNRPDIHKEIIEELITGECGLPTSTNDAINDKLNAAQKLIDRSRPKDKRVVGGLTADELKQEIAKLEKSRHKEDQELLTLYKRDLAEIEGGADTERLDDVMQELRKVLANIPQAWRYQISQPVNVSALENNLKIWRDKVENDYNIKILDKHILNAGINFFNAKYNGG
jgi:hypothetical protein